MANEIHNMLKNSRQSVALERDRIGRASQGLPATANDAGKQSERGDQVTLTNTVVKLRELSRQLAEEHFVDTQHVEQVRQQLNEGTYVIDAAKIADVLLAHERYLFSEKSP